MKTSISISRLMGPVLLIIGIGMALGLLMETDYSSLMKEFIGNRAVIFLTGILALLAGVAIVNAHNLWVPDWRLIITILGWLLVLRGIMLLVFPEAVQSIGDHIVASGRGVMAGAAVTFVLGAILCIMGYEDLWAEKPPRRSTATRTAPSKAASSRARRAKTKRPRRKRRS
jgi:hypothetical protein